MKPAAFEEREYESPLYNQLVADDPRVWSPGQVFEGHVGVDYALFLDDPWLFRLHGHGSVLPGAVLSRYAWPRSWFRRRTPRKLPTFHLNLFIQAKRPEWGRRVPAHLRTAGILKPYWRFNVDAVQQRSLERVARKLGNRALVVYAAPSFHQHSDLWRHTTSGTIVQNSTFPSASALSGHQAWYYCRPGAVGVPNPDYRPIEEPVLSERIEKLRVFKSDESRRQGLKDLAGSISESLSDEKNEPDSRVAAFFDLQRQWQVDVQQLEEGPALKAYLTVLAFSEIFNLNWCVIDSQE
jgi:hypothetical protein